MYVKKADLEKLLRPHKDRVWELNQRLMNLQRQRRSHERTIKLLRDSIRANKFLMQAINAGSMKFRDAETKEIFIDSLVMDNERMHRNLTTHSREVASVNKEISETKDALRSLKSFIAQFGAD